MPIYEYTCEKCHQTFDALILSSKEKDPKCPKCGHDRVKRLMSAGKIHGGHGRSSMRSGCAPSGG